MGRTLKEEVNSKRENWKRSLNTKLCNLFLIKEVKIFDVYQGENIPEDKKSIAINVSIQSNEKTLKEQELDLLNKSIIELVEKKTGAKIRS